MINEVVSLHLPSGGVVSYRMNFDLDRPHDRNVWSHLKFGRGYEPEVCHFLLRYLRAGDTALDIGSNFGFFTLLMAKLVGSHGKVIALEAAEVARNSLCGNVRINPDLLNVEVMDKAASSETGKATFFLSSDDPAGSCLWDPGQWFENRISKVTQKPTDVDTIALDDLRVKRVRLIKSDTEGAEHKIFRGAKELLTNSQPAIVMELNPFGMTQMNTSTEELRDYLGSFGYSMFFLHADGRIPSLVPTDTKVVYERQWGIKNCLFAMLDQVAEAWPEAGE